MLNKKFKLNRFDFLNQKKGDIINTPFFRVKTIKINQENISLEKSKQKLGIIISKKYIKKANKRNALKRKICYAYLEINKNNPDLFKNKILIISLIKKEKSEQNILGETFNNYQEIKKQIESIFLK